MTEKFVFIGDGVIEKQNKGKWFIDKPNWSLNESSLIERRR